MTRINLINPLYLPDQHLNAENHEIVCVFGYYRNHHVLTGKPHHLYSAKVFYQDKLLYLKNRHEVVKAEMRKRTFNPTITIQLSDYDPAKINDWQPQRHHIDDIVERILLRIRQKPHFYRYYRQYKPYAFFKELLKNV